MKATFRIARIAGMDIGVHYTLFISFALVTWGLARTLYPTIYPDWAGRTFWLAGAASAFFLFSCVLLHEMAHAFTALAFGLPVKGITLFVLGGVSNLGADARSAKGEFLISVMGPLVSLVLGGVMWVAYFFWIGDPSQPVAAVVAYLAVVNLLIAAFNMLPGFPLDGGRVLRSVIWATTGDFLRATRIAARTGQALALLLVVGGLAHMLLGNMLGGIWVSFVGWFLFVAAASSHGEALRQAREASKVMPLNADREPIPLFPNRPWQGAEDAPERDRRAA